MTDVARLPAPTTAQVIGELERELRMRATVYPQLVYQRRLKQYEADHRNACLRKAIAIVRELAEGESPHGR